MKKKCLVLTINSLYKIVTSNGFIIFACVRTRCCFSASLVFPGHEEICLYFATGEIANTWTTEIIMELLSHKLESMKVSNFTSY